MHIAEYLEQSRFERRLLRLLSPPGDRSMRPADSGRTLPVPVPGLPLPESTGEGRIYPLHLQPNLQALAIECQAGPAGFRFASYADQDFRLLAYARRSQGEIRIDGRALDALSSGDDRAGRSVLVPAGARVEWSLEPGDSVQELLLFQRETGARKLTRTKDGAHSSASNGDRPRFQALSFRHPRIAMTVDRIFETVAMGGAEPLGFAMLAFAWMLDAAEAAEQFPAHTAAQVAGVPPAELRKIQQARSIVFQEYLNPPTTVRLARRVALNEYKLKRGYRLVYATSIHADLRCYRMHLARDLLLAGETNVAAAACAVGYSNPGHFARAFQAQFGIAPGQLTRANRPLVRGKDRLAAAGADHSLASLSENYTQSQ